MPTGSCAGNHRCRDSQSYSALGVGTENHLTHVLVEACMDCKSFGDIAIKSSAVQIIIRPNVKYVGNDKGGETSDECNANDTGKRTLQNLLLQVTPHPQKYNVRGIISCECEASAVHISHSSNAVSGLRERVHY